MEEIRRKGQSGKGALKFLVDEAGFCELCLSGSGREALCGFLFGLEGIVREHCTSGWRVGLPLHIGTLSISEGEGSVAGRRGNWVQFRTTEGCRDELNQQDTVVTRAMGSVPLQEETDRAWLALAGQDGNVAVAPNMSWEGEQGNVRKKSYLN